MMNKITFLILTALILIPASVIAAETGDIIPVRKVDVSLTHKNYMEPSQFGIIMKVPNAVSGCFDISPLEYETSFIEGNFMDIKVNGFRRTTVKGVNPAYDCDTRNKVISNMVVINAEDLRARGIRQLRFSNGNVQDLYNIKISEDSIHLKAKQPLVFKPMSDVLSYNFVGKGIIALHVPMAQKGDDVAQAVRNIAQKNALYNEAPDNDPSDNVFFFTDQSGDTTGKLSDKAYVEFGTINVPRPFDSVDGRQAISIPLKVFATHPETTL